MALSTCRVLHIPEAKMHPPQALYILGDDLVNRPPNPHSTRGRKIGVLSAHEDIILPPMKVNTAWPRVYR